MPLISSTTLVTAASIPFLGPWVHTRDDFRPSQRSLEIELLRCCSITGSIVGFWPLFNHLSSHIFKFIFKLNFFCNRNTIFRNSWCTKGLVYNNISPGPSVTFTALASISTPFNILVRASISNFTFCCHFGSQFVLLKF